MKNLKKVKVASLALLGLAMLSGIALSSYGVKNLDNTNKNEIAVYDSNGVLIDSVSQADYQVGIDTFYHPDDQSLFGQLDREEDFNDPVHYDAKWFVPMFKEFLFNGGSESEGESTSKQNMNQLIIFRIIQVTIF